MVGIVVLDKCGGSSPAKSEAPFPPTFLLQAVGYQEASGRVGGYP